MSADAVEPASGGERNDALDALRGAALLGVLLVNLLTAFRISLFEQFLPHEPASSPIERGIERALSLGVESKAFIAFSFLFGVGLAIQHDRTNAKGKSFAPYAARRLGFLLVLGLVHLLLVWNGDILTLYAVAGALAAPLLRHSTRVLAAIAAALFVVHTLPLPWPPMFAGPEAMREHVETARVVYATGTFSEVLAFRIREVWPIAPLLFWSLPRSLALLFLGAWAARVELFERSDRRRDAFALVAIVVGGLLVWAAHDEPSALGRALLPASRGGPILLSLGYVAAFLAAYARPGLRRVLAWLAPIGRMALTSYLIQSIVFGVLFYGYGLGLFGRLDRAPTLLLGVFVFIVQAIASALWLRRFRFGPIEWAWRSFTYGALQPLRKGGIGDHGSVRG